MPLTLQILIYALVAAFSPVVLVTTLTVLLSGRGRLNGLAYAVGFVGAQIVVCAIGFAIGAAVTSEPSAASRRSWRRSRSRWVSRCSWQPGAGGSIRSGGDHRARGRSSRP